MAGGRRGGSIMAPLSSKSIFDSVLIFTGCHSAVCVCLLGAGGGGGDALWNLEVGPDKAVQGPDLITSCFFTRSLPVCSLWAWPAGRQKGRKGGCVLFRSAWCWCCRVGTDGVTLLSPTSSTGMSHTHTPLRYLHGNGAQVPPWRRLGPFEGHNDLM